VNAEELKARSKRFAVQIVHLTRELVRTEEGRIVGRQLLKSATSVAANYRAVCRARSKAEFVAKIGIVVEEADETVFWLELIEDTRILPKERVGPLLREAGELLAIMAASQRTARGAAAGE
jgi:four helix bundle protein